MSKTKMNKQEALEKIIDENLFTQPFMIELVGEEPEYDFDSDTAFDTDDAKNKIEKKQILIEIKADKDMIDNVEANYGIYDNAIKTWAKGYEADGYFSSILTSDNSITIVFDVPGDNDHWSPEKYLDPTEFGDGGVITPMTKKEVIQWMVDAYVMIGENNSEGKDEGKNLLNSLIKILKKEQEYSDSIEEKTKEQLALEAYPRLINDPYNPQDDDNSDYREIWIKGYDIGSLHNLMKAKNGKKIASTVNDYDQKIIDAIKSWGEDSEGLKFIQPKDVLRISKDHEVYAFNLSDGGDFLLDDDRSEKDVEKMIESGEYAFFIENEIAGVDILQFSNGGPIEDDITEYKEKLEIALVKKYNVNIKDTGFDDTHIKVSMKKGESIDHVVDVIGNMYQLTPVNTNISTPTSKGPKNHICVIKDKSGQEIGRYDVAYTDDEYLDRVFKAIGVKLRASDTREILKN